MKKIYLYEGKGKYRKLSDNFTLVDDSDYEYLMQWEWSMMKIYHTDKKLFYVRRYEGKTMLGTYKAILMHRFILGLIDKEDKGDHIDGNGLNNQRSNLKKTTHSENLANVHPLIGDNYRGVVKLKSGLYKVSLSYKKQRHHIDYLFVSKDIAALAYNELALSIKNKGTITPVLNIVNPYQ